MSNKREKGKRDPERKPGGDQRRERWTLKTFLGIVVHLDCGLLGSLFSIITEDLL